MYFSAGMTRSGDDNQIELTQPPTPATAAT